MAVLTMSIRGVVSRGISTRGWQQRLSQPARSLSISGYSQPNSTSKDEFNESGPSVLVTGALGQLGNLLVNSLRGKIGNQNVLATDIHKYKKHPGDHVGPYKYLDVLDYARMNKIVVEHNITHIVHFSALLSAVGEQHIEQAIKVNNQGTGNVFEVARHHNLSVFCPSTIGAFGPSTPQDMTPDLTVMRPTTIYGITKVYMELLGEYYNKRFKVDFRSLRLPGVLSADTTPGGGTTDYAVSIFHHAVNHPDKPFVCYLKPTATLPMIMIDDCVRGMIEFMEVDENQLTQRTYNFAAVSFSPEEIAAAIRKRIPSFEIVYEPDERQDIADSWPKSLDDTNARNDWDWNHAMGIEEIVDFMIDSIRKQQGL